MWVCINEALSVSLGPCTRCVLSTLVEYKSPFLFLHHVFLQSEWDRLWNEVLSAV